MISGKGTQKEFPINLKILWPAYCICISSRKNKPAKILPPQTSPSELKSPTTNYFEYSHDDDDLRERNPKSVSHKI